ncbi:MAG TPA: PEP/pyruvate-binding domain-containing protein [Syntrophomonas sp.]|nr:PEP/pyruvate-binding domain-containing protein [Syntrophomonas sp.]
MNERMHDGDYSLDNLKERAKELNCLYQVDEILNNRHLSLAEIFSALVKVIPSGWQFPEFCKVLIVYENRRYYTEGFSASTISESCDIKVNGKVIGRIEVVYVRKVNKSEEGYFLDKERKLIRTIADRIGQTIFQRYMGQLLRQWDNSRQEPLAGNAKREWMVIVDLIGRSNQNALLHICRKMANHLYLSGVKEAEEVLWDFGSGFRGDYAGEVNYPSEKFPLGNLQQISQKIFRIAEQHLSDDEISIRLKQWIEEEKAFPLIKAVDRIDVSVREIVKLLNRYKNSYGDTNRPDFPMERWLVVALIQRFLSEKLDFINIARQHLEIIDFYAIVNQLIFPEGSHGKIGGKGTGLFLAEQVLAKAQEENPLLKSVKVPRTWYISTDEIKEIIHYNNLEELNVQKYKDLYEIRLDYPNIIQILKNAEFPQGIIKSLAMALDDFGDVPLIVRSSSLLEDQMGAAFSGKYKSLFLANQGSKQERMEALVNAIMEVYASIYSPDSIQYRSERGLLDFNEEMGILIQEVVGRRVGVYYLPVYAGVAFSHNEFRWSPRIKREDGLLRLVMGLGTRAVDRLSDDFPVLISPGQPGLRVNTVPQEIQHYAPKKVDLINLEKNTFDTVEIAALVKQFGHDVPQLQQYFSIYQQDYVKKPLAFEIDCENDEVLLTFDGLIADTTFVKQVKLILEVLEEKLATPVDIEFASDGEHFYLLQCRPQSSAPSLAPAPIPKEIPAKDIIFSARRYISNGTVNDISHIVYVDPNEYNRLTELEDLVNVGKAVGMLNLLLPRHRFVLIGPGRWGSRGDIKMGVQVSYADINNTAALIEVARKKSNYIPELSFGTHFFQDLVEAQIRYLPLYPDDPGMVFNERFLRRTSSILAKILPEYARLEEVIRVIDVPASTNGRILKIVMNADLEEALAYLAEPAGMIDAAARDGLGETWTARAEGDYVDDRFWRWRYYMAERLAERLDFDAFGVKGLYLFGSTNNGTAGPGSDIDLLVHFQGNPVQREQLKLWLQGWSISLAEMNYLKTGYATDELLDIHIITDEDLVNKSAFAIKIGAVTDPAHPLKIKQDY